MTIDVLYPNFSLMGSATITPTIFPIHGMELSSDCWMALISYSPFLPMVPKVPSHDGVTWSAPNMAVSKPNNSAPKLKTMIASHAF